MSAGVLRSIRASTHWASFHWAGQCKGMVEVTRLLHDPVRLCPVGVMRHIAPWGAGRGSEEQGKVELGERQGVNKGFPVGEPKLGGTSFEVTFARTRKYISLGLQQRWSVSTRLDIEWG